MRPWSIIPIPLQIADKNLNLDGAFSPGNNIDPTLWSVIAEDGKVIEINIDDTEGWTINLLEDGDVVFIILDAKAKSGKVYSALELSLNYIYKMPLPREHVDLGMLSPTSLQARRAPHRSSRHSRRSRPNARRRSPGSLLTESSRNAALMSQFASLATFKFVSIII
jgi:hypothetical protein